MVKQNDTELAFASGTKNIIILKHARGRDIQIVGKISVRDINELYGIHGYGKKMAANGLNGGTEVWDCVTKIRTASFKRAAIENFVKIREDFIICGRTEDGVIDIN